MRDNLEKERGFAHIHVAIIQIDGCVDNILKLLLNPFEKDVSQLFTDEEDQYISKILTHAELIKITIKEVPASILNENYGEEKLNQFFTSLRHDLRNHINAMMGYAEMILESFQEKPSNLDPQKFITIVSESSKMLKFFSQLQISPTLEKETIINPSKSAQNYVHETNNTHGDEEESTEFISFKKTFSILIVDDEDENCKLLELHLLKDGYESICIVHNAFEAKNQLGKQKTDLVLLDINMPEISGIELLESLKSEIAKFKLMVVMVTGEDTLENAMRCIRLGAEDYLTKPVDAAMLKVRVSTCLRKKWFFFRESEYARHLEIERKRFENLLRSIFPRVIVKELSETGHVLARTYENVAMLFVDVVNFTNFCDTNPVEDTMKGIQEFSEICETAAIKYNLQKIKTIGDGFLASAGMLTKHDNSVLDCVSCALDILEKTKNAPSHWLVRAGIDFGTIIGGVVGHRQYLFDVWGDVVNTASRVQSIASPEKVCLTDKAWDKIKNISVGHSLGFIQLKGKSKSIEIIQFVKKI
jgi:adenylate cyclase